MKICNTGKNTSIIKPIGKAGGNDLETADKIHGKQMCPFPTLKGCSGKLINRRPTWQLPKFLRVRNQAYKFP